MSLNVPSDVSEHVRGAKTEVVDHETFVAICKDSLPGAVKMYELMRERLKSESVGSYRKCFHGFTDVERGHVIRACYGDAINRELREHFGVTLVRVSTGRVVGFTPSAAANRDFRSKVFELSAQKAHGDDPVETPAIIDHPDTLREIERLYPLAYAHIAAHAGQPYIDLESGKPKPLFAQLVEMISIRPYRFLLEDAFGPMATVNCCGSAGKGKEDPKREKKSKAPKDEKLGELDWDFLTSRTLQIQQQEPYLVDC